MNRLLIFAFVILSAVCADCSRDKKEAGEVANRYLTLMGNYQFDEAKAYATDKQIETISRAQRFADQISDEDKQKVLPVTITIEDITISNDSAFVDFESSSPVFKNKGTLTMVKQDGKWLACKQAKKNEHKNE